MAEKHSTPEDVTSKNIDSNNVDSHDFIILFKKLASEIMELKNQFKKLYRPKKEVTEKILNINELILNLQINQVYKLIENKNIFNTALSNRSSSNKTCQTDVMINMTNLENINNKSSFINKNIVCHSTYDFNKSKENSILAPGIEQNLNEINMRNNLNEIV